MTKKKAKTEKPPSFEELMERLEEIASELESGELGLEKAIALYEEGVRCYRQCHEILTGAEKKVEVLTRNDKGELEAKPFEEEADEDDEPAEKPEEDASGKDAAPDRSLF